MHRGMAECGIPFLVTVTLTSDLISSIIVTEHFSYIIVS